jgi:hypothetical protein
MRFEWHVFSYLYMLLTLHAFTCYSMSPNYFHTACHSLACFFIPLHITPCYSMPSHYNPCSSSTFTCYSMLVNKNAYLFRLFHATSLCSHAPFNPPSIPIPIIHSISSPLIKNTRRCSPLPPSSSPPPTYSPSLNSSSDCRKKRSKITDTAFSERKRETHTALHTSHEC